MIILIAAKNNLNNENIGLVEAFKQAFSRWGSCIGTSIIAGLMVLGLAFCLIVPGIIWAVYYTFIVQIVILKKISGKDALDYSKSLVKRNKKVFLVLFLIWTLNIVPEYVITRYTSGANAFIIVGGSFVVDLISAFVFIMFTVIFLKLDSFHLMNSSKASDTVSSV